MMNSRILYLPTDKLTFKERKEIVGFFNPIMHRESSLQISGPVTETDVKDPVFELLVKDSFCCWPNFGTLIKQETISDEISSFKTCSSSSPELISTKFKFQKPSSLDLKISEVENSNKITISLENMREENKKNNIEDNIETSTYAKHPLNPQKLVWENDKLASTKNVLEDDKNYERKNVYYKTLLRDFRKFICSDFNEFIKNSEPSLIPFLNEIMPNERCGGLGEEKEANTTQFQMPKLTPYCMVNRSTRLKLFIPLLHGYTNYLFGELFPDSKPKFTQETNIRGSLRFMSEEDIIQTDDTYVKDKLMMILGCFIHCKDFEQTKWAKVKVHKLTQIQKSEGLIFKDSGKRARRCSPDESILTPKIINTIFKTFSQKKLKLIFKVTLIQKLFKFYAEDGNRISKHKSMSIKDEKYSVIKTNILNLCV